MNNMQNMKEVSCCDPGMMVGMGVIWILVLIILVLAIIALITYISRKTVVK